LDEIAADLKILRHEFPHHSIGKEGDGATFEGHGRGLIVFMGKGSPITEKFDGL
jgi:hypothetical protein